MKNYYVYLYLREDNTPYYVGKGKNNRAYQKHGNYRRWNPPTPERIVKVRENLTNHEALKLEAELITQYGLKRDGGILINLTLGGQGTDGYFHTEETKQKLRERHTRRDPATYNPNRKQSEDTKEKLRQATLKQHREGRATLSSVPVTINGTTYPSRKAACETLGIPKSTLYKRIREGRLLY